MKQCPCCGSALTISRQSRVRQSVMVCNNCFVSGKEVNGGTWWVDNQKPSKELKDYFKALEDYDVALNCNPNKAEVERYKQRYLMLRNTRAQKLVVVTEHMDGASPLFETIDSNLAVAYVYGWLGSHYTQVNRAKWISMHGSVISIEMM